MGRPDDRVGVAGVINNISGVHQDFSILGHWRSCGRRAVAEPRPGEDHRSLLQLLPDLCDETHLDYQFIDNPGYNTDRGPANFFAGRVHWQF